MGSRGTRSTTGTRARLRRGIARDGRRRPTSTISLSYLMPLQPDRFANPMSIGVVRSNCPRLPPSDPNYLPAHPNRGVFDSQQPHHSLCLLGCHRAHPSSRRERRPIERTSTSPRSPTRGPPQPYPPKARREPESPFPCSRAEPPANPDKGFFRPRKGSQPALQNKTSAWIVRLTLEPRASRTCQEKPYLARRSTASHAIALRHRRLCFERAESFPPMSPSRPGSGRRRDRRGGTSSRAGGAVAPDLPDTPPGSLSTLRSGRVPLRWRLTTCVVSLLCFSVLDWGPWS